jgi:hypothetical protein
VSPLAIALLAALLPAPQAAPDEPGARAAAEFDHLRNEAVVLLRANARPEALERVKAAKKDERAETQTRELGYQRVSALDPTASSAVDRVTLGLGTSVEGAEAGLAVSPAALVGSTNLKAIAFNVFVGALKSDETRVGMRYTLERSGRLEPSMVPSECPFVESQARAWLDPIGNEYRDVCRVVAQVTSPPPAVPAATWAIAQAACGVPGAAYPKAGDRNLRVALVVLADVAKALRSSASDEIAREARAVATAADELEKFDPTRFLDCFGSEKALAERFRIEQWRQGTTKLGLSTHVDFFARRFGFSPDGKELPGGQVKAWQSRFDLSRQRGRGQWTLGMGAGVARQDFKGDYTLTLTPAVSASYIAFSLTGRSLLESQTFEENGADVTVDVIRLEDGKIAPHAVIGFLAKAEIAPSPPDTQTTHFNAFEAQAFMDFKIRENLSFRLGIPVRAELKTRPPDAKASPPVLKQSSLQWSVPVAIVTVIKL